VNKTQFSYPLECKFAEPDESGVFSGLASTWGGVDLVGDTVMPGAFAASLAEHKRAGSAPAMLWHHQQASPIGVWREIREGRDGLEVRGKLALGVARGQEAYELMLTGALSLSIGYIAIDTDTDSKGNRVLRAVDLFEISLVSIPANPQARIGQVKSISNIRSFEEVLREHGLSRRQARRVANHGFGALAENEEHEIKVLADLLRASAIKWSKT
jgi:Escherichia/Staphylococcus phage prohead protease